jgi:hypothetical protein
MDVDVLFVMCYCHFTALDRALGTIELEDVRHWSLYGHGDGDLCFVECLLCFLFCTLVPSSIPLNHFEMICCCCYIKMVGNSDIPYLPGM